MTGHVTGTGDEAVKKMHCHFPHDFMDTRRIVPISRSILIVVLVRLVGPILLLVYVD